MVLFLIFITTVHPSNPDRPRPCVAVPVRRTSFALWVLRPDTVAGKQGPTGHHSPGSHQSGWRGQGLRRGVGAAVGRPVAPRRGVLPDARRVELHAGGRRRGRADGVLAVLRGPADQQPERGRRVATAEGVPMACGCSSWVLAGMWLKTVRNLDMRIGPSSTGGVAV